MTADDRTGMVTFHWWTVRSADAVAALNLLDFHISGDFQDRQLEDRIPILDLTRRGG